MTGPRVTRPCVVRLAVVDSLGFSDEAFAADDCSIVEGSMDAMGLRRPLRIDTIIVNFGELPIVLGGPRVGVTGVPGGACTHIVTVRAAGEISELVDRYPNTVRVPVHVPNPNGPP